MSDDVFDDVVLAVVAAGCEVRLEVLADPAGGRLVTSRGTDATGGPDGRPQPHRSDNPSCPDVPVPGDWRDRSSDAFSA
ncbi:MAG TPA: hypothetical protein VF635_01365 [Propionibacteriaceae bacterium]|jgi:hypothetical protein